MSTTMKPLKYLWSGIFANGHVIDQPVDDHYSKHDAEAEYNPSAFRDLQDYMDNVCTLRIFQLGHYKVNLLTGEWVIDGSHFFMNDNDINSERKLIYFRTVSRDSVNGEWQEPEIISYNFGYEYKNKKGENVQRIITIDGK